MSLDDLLGDVIEEMLDEGAPVGPIEFEGREDYIRGETACLRGCDIVGMVPQIGASMPRKFNVQNQGAGFSIKTTPNGRTFTGLNTKRTATSLNLKAPNAKVLANLRKIVTFKGWKDVVNAAKTAAKNAEMVGKSLKNFKSPTPAAHPVKSSRRKKTTVVGEFMVDEILPPDDPTYNLNDGPLPPDDTTVGFEWDDLVGRLSEYEEVFGDVVGAGVSRVKTQLRKISRQILPSDAKVRALAAELTKTGGGLKTHATTFEKDTKGLSSKLKAGLQSTRKTYNPSGRKGQRVIGGDDDFVEQYRNSMYEMDLGNKITTTQFEGDTYTVSGDIEEDLANGNVMQDIFGDLETDLANGTMFDNIFGDGANDMLGLGTPDSNNPGYYTDGTLIPTAPGDMPDGQGYMKPSGAFDPAFGPPDAFNGAGGGGGSTQYDQTAELPPGPEENYGMGPVPTLESIVLKADEDYQPDPNGAGGNNPEPYSDLTQTDPNDPLSGLPLGAVLYSKDIQPWPWQGVGSYTRFFPQGGGEGGQNDGLYNSGFQWGGGDAGIMDGWYWWWHGASSGTEYKHEKAGNTLSQPGTTGLNFAHNDWGQGWDDCRERAKISVANTWGPLIGNPNTPMKGLRYDMKNDRWFWYYDQAPEIFKQGIRLALLNKAVLQYKTDLETAKATYLQAVATAKADKAAADKQAKDWANQQTQMQQQQERADADAAAQATRDAAAQATADQQYGNQQDQLDLQQQQLDQQAYDAYLKAGGNPYAEQQDDDGGQQDGGSVRYGSKPTFSSEDELTQADQRQPSEQSPFDDMYQEDSGPADPFGEPTMDSSEKDMAAADSRDLEF